MRSWIRRRTTEQAFMGHPSFPNSTSVIPAQAGIQRFDRELLWRVVYSNNIPLRDLRPFAVFGVDSRFPTTQLSSVTFANSCQQPVRIATHDSTRDCSAARRRARIDIVEIPFTMALCSRQNAGGRPSQGNSFRDAFGAQMRSPVNSNSVRVSLS